MRDRGAAQPLAYGGSTGGSPDADYPSVITRIPPAELSVAAHSLECEEPAQLNPVYHIPLYCPNLRERCILGEIDPAAARS